MRLQKYLARCGVASRRKSEELILNSKVKVNDKVITELGFKVKENDIVKYNDKILKFEEKIIYKLYKPIKVLSSVSDNRGRKCITDFYDGKLRLYPVGRLDYMSEGLIFLTNDGELANKLTHPKYNKSKEYIVYTNKYIDNNVIEKLISGVIIDGYKTRSIRIEKKGDKKYLFILYEGRNRQIRKMLEKFGINVKKLIRISQSGVNIKNLKIGEIQKLTEKEKEKLFDV